MKPPISDPGQSSLPHRFRRLRLSVGEAPFRGLHRHSGTLSHFGPGDLPQKTRPLGRVDSHPVHRRGGHGCDLRRGPTGRQAQNATRHASCSSWFTVKKRCDMHHGQRRRSHLRRQAKMHFPSHLFCAVIRMVPLALAIAGPAKAASVQQTDVVPMQRFEVKEDRGYFDYDVRYDDQTERVQEIKITWVSSAAHKNALRVGDRLVSIDGTSISELRYGEFLARMNRNPKAAEPRILVFTRVHLLRRLTITHTTKGPNSAPEPTPTAATPPAREEPRQP